MYSSKSPFKPIKKPNSDPFLEFMQEEAAKSEKASIEDSVFAGYINSENNIESKEYQPQLKEAAKAPAPKIEKYTVNIKDEDVFIKQKYWSKTIASLYMDIFNADKSLDDISKEIKNIMARNGIEVNTEDADRVVCDTQERMMKIFVAKNLCYSLGMASDWSTILVRELDLVYPKRESNKP